MHYETPSGPSYETVHAHICHSVMWVPGYRSSVRPIGTQSSLPALLRRRTRVPKLGELRSGVAPAEDRLLVPVVLGEYGPREGFALIEVRVGGPLDTTP